ncbi:MAG TPA: hypothetical protein VFN10_23945 [Thermoanaerobaculia bacterium]|nr:hypothetical protein [Thermoanaerobaculia bacterium]
MRYIKKLTRLGSLGPTEERGAGVWVGYDIDGVDEDLSAQGFVRADTLTDDELAARGVKGFTRIAPEKLGLRRKDEDG